MNPHAFAALCVMAASHAPELPQARSFARYEELMSRSPFAVATAVPTRISLTDLYVSSVARSADDCVVTLSSTKDGNVKERVSTKHPSKSGYIIKEFNPSNPK